MKKYFWVYFWTFSFFLNFSFALQGHFVSMIASGLSAVMFLVSWREANNNGR